MPNDIPLGKKVQYPKQYNPELLFPISREGNRAKIGVTNHLPFTGVDIWNAYELSWLNSKGKPEIATAEFIVPCESKNIFESKSLKLYLNSFNHHVFPSIDVVKQTIQKDLSNVCGQTITVNLYTPESFATMRLDELDGTCLDHQDIEISDYEQPNPSYLKTLDHEVEETLHSHLYKSNCEITQQPDWGSVLIQYSGKQIDHAGLLKYIISFRHHCEFHEPCAERMFMDILRQCEPKKLMVYMRYTRRGGIDINPLRTNFEVIPRNIRLIRQ
ncbi:MAG: NADPH-dependent 7-cyano-7-deazaguanine reductase QueF [Proteobacteria bacterium]|nr:NADPH-dependent 7-cyano-7-deazaguanine reductase QueF [Pseudomonadota bacterium]